MAEQKSKIKAKFNAEKADDRPDLLSQAEYEAAVLAIERDYFARDGVAPSQTPSLLYVTGLAGAGKTTLVEKFKKAASQKHHPLHINFDDLRFYHPRYLKHVQENPLHAAARTDLAVVRLFEYAVGECVKQKCNVIIDDAPVDAAATLALLASFQKAGYHISAMVLATPYALCQKRVHARFVNALALSQKGEPVIPRFVNEDEQAKAPKILMETMRLMEAEKAVDLMTIFNQKGRVLYRGALERPQNLARMLEAELFRVRPKAHFSNKKPKK